MRIPAGFQIYHNHPPPNRPQKAPGAYGHPGPQGIHNRIPGHYGPHPLQGHPGPIRHQAPDTFNGAGDYLNGNYPAPFGPPVLRENHRHQLPQGTNRESNRHNRSKKYYRPYRHLQASNRPDGLQGARRGNPQDNPAIVQVVREDSAIVQVVREDQPIVQVGVILASSISAEEQLRGDELETRVKEVLLNLKKLRNICTTQIYMDKINELIEICESVLTCTPDEYSEYGGEQDIIGIIANANSQIDQSVGVMISNAGAPFVL